MNYRNYIAIKNGMNYEGWEVYISMEQSPFCFYE